MITRAEMDRQHRDHLRSLGVPVSEDQAELHALVRKMNEAARCRFWLSFGRKTTADHIADG